MTNDVVRLCGPAREFASNAAISAGEQATTGGPSERPMHDAAMNPDGLPRGNLSSSARLRPAGGGGFGGWRAWRAGAGARARAAEGAATGESHRRAGC